MLKKRNSPKTKAEMRRLGRKIYDHQLTVAEAAVIYNVNFYTARNWLRFYKSELKLKNQKDKIKKIEEYDTDVHTTSTISM